MKTNDSGRTTAIARASRSASADHGSGNEAGATNRPHRAEAASTTYAMSYVDAAPELRHTADPARHLRQRALLRLAARREDESALLALLDELVVAQWAAKRDAQRRAQQAAQWQAAAQLTLERPLERPRYAQQDDEAYSPAVRDPYRDRDLTD